MRIAIITFPGSADGSDILEALLSVGFTEDQVAFKNEQTTSLEEFSGIFIPGGAVYANAVRPGAVAKVAPVARAIIAFSESGKPIIGIGNGFQILTELALLPGGFLKNKDLRTVNGIVTVSETFNADQPPKTLKLPISHLYGQYHVDNKTLEELKEHNQIILRYAEHNPNGSVCAISGVRNKAGNVIGMMPKPERAMSKLVGSEDGRTLFELFFHHMTKGL